MALDVKVKIDLTKPAGKAGFGVPLILEQGATKEIAYTECRSLADVVSAGFATTTEVYKAANLIFMQDTPPEKIAVCATTGTPEAWLANVDNVSKDWRQLIVIGNFEDINVGFIMTAIEALDNKMYFVDVPIDDESVLSVAGINRTVLFYHNLGCATAALVGATASLPAGSFTYKNLVLKGIEPQKLTETEIDAIHAKGGITFVTKAGDNVTSEGKTAGGEYIDIIDSKDYVISNLEYQTQKTLNTMPKIPYDNNGIAILESVAVNVMRDAYNNGIIATGEDGKAAYTVNYAKREQTDETDRAVRRYVGGSFAFTLAGAIHEVNVTGEIEI
jgi:hypothetical protein